MKNPSNLAVKYPFKATLYDEICVNNVAGHRSDKETEQCERKMSLMMKSI